MKNIKKVLVFMVFTLISSLFAGVESVSAADGSLLVKNSTPRATVILSQDTGMIQDGIEVKTEMVVKTGITNAAGTVSFTNLPAGDYVVYFAKANFFLKKIENVSVSAGIPTELVVNLKSTLGSIKVSSNPTNVLVKLYREGNDTTVVGQGNTGASGILTLENVPQGRYKVVLSKANYTDWFNEVFFVSAGVVFDLGMVSLNPIVNFNFNSLPSEGTVSVGSQESVLWESDLSIGKNVNFDSIKFTVNSSTNPLFKLNNGDLYDFSLSVDFQDDSASCEEEPRTDEENGDQGNDEGGDSDGGSSSGWGGCHAGLVLGPGTATVGEKNVSFTIPSEFKMLEAGTYKVSLRADLKDTVPLGLKFKFEVSGQRDIVFKEVDTNKVVTKFMNGGAFAKLVAGELTIIDKVMVDLVETSASLIAGDVEIGQSGSAAFNIDFRVTATNEDIYIDNSCSEDSGQDNPGEGLSFKVSNPVLNSAVCNLFTVFEPGDSSDTFLIEQGESRNFVFHVVVSNPSAEHFVFVSLEALNWGFSPENTNNKFYMFDQNVFKTNFIFLNSVATDSQGGGGESGGGSNDGDGDGGSN